MKKQTMVLIVEKETTGESTTITSIKMVGDDLKSVLKEKYLEEILLELRENDIKRK